MEIKVIRRPKAECKISTIGQLNIDGAAECYTLEPPTPEAWPCKKGTGCHPLGKYQITLSKNHGSVWGWMKNLVPDIDKYGLPLISNIAGEKYEDWIPEGTDECPSNGVDAGRCVYIHIGCEPKDTEGCLCTGLTKGQNCIAQSTDAFNKVYPQIVDAIVNRNENVTIEFVESAL